MNNGVFPLPKEKTQGINIIFLDVDGVLNCETTKDRCGRYVGIEDQKVSYLKEIVDTCHAKIVLVSTWKEFWKKEPYKKHQDYLANYLDHKLAKQGLKIVDKTTDYNGLSNRGAGIQEYLSFLKTNEILVNNYVILDDLIFDYLKTKLTKNLVKTNYDKGGLQPIHVKKAIRILNEGYH